MILRWTTLFWLVVVGVAVGLVFQVTAAVQDLEAELRATQEEIHRDREAIHVLRAEWDFLNRPERVSRLAEELLGMVPLTAPNFTRIAALGPRPEFMDGRVYPDGPPVPPRRPAFDPGLDPTFGPGERGDWREALPAPASGTGESDPIGDLVAATLAEAARSPAPEPTLPPADGARSGGESLGNESLGNESLGNESMGGERPAVPVNPVTGAPLPVGASFVSEAR